MVTRVGYEFSCVQTRELRSQRVDVFGPSDGKLAARNVERGDTRRAGKLVDRDNRGHVVRPPRVEVLLDREVIATPTPGMATDCRAEPFGQESIEVIQLARPASSEDETQGVDEPET